MAKYARPAHTKSIKTPIAELLAAALAVLGWLDEIRRDPAYLAREHLRVLRGWGEQARGQAKKGHGSCVTNCTLNCKKF